MLFDVDYYERTLLFLKRLEPTIKQFLVLRTTIDNVHRHATDNNSFEVACFCSIVIKAMNKYCGETYTDYMREYL